MDKHLRGYGTHVPRPALFRFLPDLSGDKKEEEHAQDYPQANYPGDCWSTGAGGSGGFTAV